MKLYPNADYSMDDIIFENRNQAYGAFQLRRDYDSHMTQGMILAILLALLVVNGPAIIRLLQGNIPEVNTIIEDHTINILQTEPNIYIPPPPAQPVTIPPSPKEQLKAMLPTVVEDDEIIEEVPPPLKEEVFQPLSNGTGTGEEMIDDPDGTLNGHGSEIGNQITINEVVQEETYTYVQQMPVFPGGQEAMYKYIYDRFKYPAIAKENGISGRILIQFVVTKEGAIEDVRIVQGIGGGCDEQAAMVIRDMPKWNPGKHNGKAVNVSFILPLKLVLQ